MFWNVCSTSVRARCTKFSVFRHIFTFSFNVSLQNITNVTIEMGSTKSEFCSASTVCFPRCNCYLSVCENNLLKIFNFKMNEVFLFAFKIPLRIGCGSNFHKFSKKENQSTEPPKKRNAQCSSMVYTLEKRNSCTWSIRFSTKKHIEFVLHNFVFNAVTFIRCASFQFVVVVVVVACHSFHFVFVIITFLQFFSLPSLIHIDSRVSGILHSFI